MKDGAKDQTPSRLGKLALTRVTTVERIADGICDLILRGEVVPGTPLRESQLQEWIGVSRNTIREALRLLERDGLVTYNAYRGVTVTELSREDVTDLFRARVAVELSAVAPAIEMGEEEMRRLEEACEARERAIADGDLHAAFEADISFHATLVAALSSEALSEFFLGLLRKLRLGFYLGGGVSTEARERDTEQHRRIVELLRDGDSKGCAAAVREHLGDAEAILLDLTDSVRSDEPAPTGAGT
ncbi:MAG TPA: GntR family transcriptional regulator [Solirubrobacterales bacterium]|nr:GntR family transcriptional regulator [Solirubrobacterales bacterium]